MNIIRKSLLAAASLLTIATTSGQAAAAGYPERPIRLVTPYAAGGLSDILARTLAQELSKRLGQSVLVDNRTGAGGIIGMDVVAKAEPDGYTLVLTSQGLASVNTTLYSNLPYDTLKDFTAISSIAKFSLVLVSNPESPLKTLDDFIDAARRNPESMNYGSAGNASTAHLTMEMLKERTGMDVMHIPYKGEALAFTELLGGRINATFATVGGALQLIQSNKVHPIAVADDKRNALLPEVPTVEESGVKDFNVFGWYAILAPAKVPQDVVDTLGSALMEIGRDEEFRKAMAARGMEAVGSTPEQATQLIRDETERWGEIITKVGIKVD
ncbi:tripartite tricarboxylate transporter substrate binding protein [Verticiella sediminum]|uniref:Tripartite tricarboxylate transporter substrate binding protein n=1 Tax=Verticiella sediminum TaxID=1247510 RepID=A0A556AJ18_9BURK|nr:tripartite tricarboxylate transporter substrate binding protein [Verticiella sediminum]TSH92904.1 tripartite tricarboxylate transporter substrate binding protein [Verticiella sediminum]